MHFWIHIELNLIYECCRWIYTKKFVDFFLFMTCYFKFFFNPSYFIIINYTYCHEWIIENFQDHVFICSIWINFEKTNVCLNLNFLNSFMSKIIKLNFLLILSKIWSGLVVKTLVHFHEVLGSNLDECVR